MRAHGTASSATPNIDAITMTYGYMAVYEDRVRRAVNTPDREGNCALWQGGMEPNIPVGSRPGVATAMQRALAGGRREQAAGASGKWVAHWKMVRVVRPVWEVPGERNQLARAFPSLTYTESDAEALTKLDLAPRTVRGARDLISVALQYGNAFGRGYVPVYRCDYPRHEQLFGTVCSILQSTQISAPFRDLERDARYVMRAVCEHFGEDFTLHENFQLRTLSSLFYRSRAAYVVGRAINGDRVQPFVIPLLKDRSGQVFADTVLFDPRSLGRVFSLARAYFMVDMEVPAAYVEFLRSLLPSKAAAEIYTMLGLHKQGKTLFYRDLVHHLAHSTDLFVPAPGVPGMVMLVFTLPSFPYVFKVIREPSSSASLHR